MSLVAFYSTEPFYSRNKCKAKDESWQNLNVCKRNNF